MTSVYLSPLMAIQMGKLWEDMGYTVIISQQIPKGGTAEDIKRRLNEGLKA